MIKHFLLSAAVAIAMATVANASISYTGSPISQDFTGYDGTTGVTGWDADGLSTGTGFTENRGASNGGVTTGGTYAFNIGGGNVALGVQPGGTDFTPGYFQLEITNDSGAAVTSWNVGFDSYHFNDQGRGNSFNFSYSTDGTTFTPVASGSFTSPNAAAPVPTWLSGAAYADTISASTASGSSFFLRWTGDDISGSGSRDEFALDNVLVSGVSVPEPTSLALLGLGIVGMGMTRRRRS